MFTEHPSPDELTAIARGDGGHAAARRHVEEGCISCTARLRQAAGAQIRRIGDLLHGAIVSTEPPSQDVYSELAARTRAWKAVGQGEDRSAEALEAELLALPLTERRDRIRRSRRFASQGLVHHLVERARDEGFREPARAVELAGLALEVAEVLEDGGLPERLAKDAQALAWAMLANAHRIQAELIEAERAMASAKRLFAEGSGQAWTRAEILSLEGSLRMDEARYEAAAVLGTAVSIYRLFGDLEREGKVTFQLGNAAGERENFGEAVELLTHARTLLHEAGARRLELYAGQALANWLRMAGRIDEARSIYESVVHDFRAEIPDAMGLLRFDWLGALLAAAEGETASAAGMLGRLREAFLAAESIYDACLVSLDLAVLYLEMGELAKVRGIAREITVVFSSRQIQHHALIALAVFQQAAERERLTAAFLDELRRYVRRAQKNPYLRLDLSTLSS